MSSQLQDILNPELAVDERRVLVRDFYQNLMPNEMLPPSLARARSVGTAKSLDEFYQLVGTALANFQTLEGIEQDNIVRYSEEEPDLEAQTESIVYGLIKRQPGQFGQGKPFSSSEVVNLRPIVREVKDDIENPGYKLTTLGYTYDNIVRFICWARTNKTANRRALWFEKFMNKYTWWFSLQGVKRVVFWGRTQDIVLDIKGNKWYGRPMDYYVATEDLETYSEKTIEEIILTMHVTNS